MQLSIPVVKRVAMCKLKTEWYLESRPFFSFVPVYRSFILSFLTLLRPRHSELARIKSTAETLLGSNRTVRVAIEEGSSSDED